MKQRLQNLIAAVLIAFTGSLAFVPAVAHADLKGDACSGINQLDSSTSATDCSPTDGSTAGSGITTIVTAIVNILSIIVGFIAVIMIIIGGIRFVTSGGDSNSVAAARSTIIYAIVGLVVVAIAQALVHFVLNKLG